MTERLQGAQLSSMAEARSRNLLLRLRAFSELRRGHSRIFSGAPALHSSSSPRCTAVMPPTAATLRASEVKGQVAT